MTRLLRLLILTLAITPALAQDITRHEADSMIKALPKTRAKQDRIDLLLQIAQFHIFKPGENKADLDSATVCITEAKALTEDGNNPFILLTEAYLLKETGQQQASKATIEKAIAQATKSKDNFHLGKAYETLASFYDYNDTRQKAEMIRLTKLAIRSFQTAGEERQQAQPARQAKQQLAYNLKYLADLYDQGNEETEALRTLDSSLKIYQSIGYTKLQSVYILYGSIYYGQGDYKSALNNILKALRIAESVKDTSMTLCEINNRAGITLMQLNEKEKALKYYKAAFDIAKKYQDNNSILWLATNIAHDFVELKRSDEALAFLNSIPPKLLQPRTEEGYLHIPLAYFLIYVNLKDYPQAERYSKKIFDIIAVHKPLDYSLNNFYLLLERYYLATQQYAAAQHYFKKIDSLSRAIGDPARIKDNYLVAFRLDTARKNYRSGIDNLLEYQRLKDSLFNDASDRQIKRLEIEYETEKKESQLQLKDKDILALNQKNQLQRYELRQASWIRNITLGVIGFLIVICWLIYRQFRLKQETNKTISVKNSQLEGLLVEKEWLLKEIHHRVKNNFQTVMGLLGTQSGYLKNETAIEAIKNSQHRIHAMSLIHQRLYQTENISEIPISGYIHELVDYLRDSFDRERVRFRTTIQPVNMGLSHCIPLGLIINEAITNAFKYAFPDNRVGVIRISLEQTQTAPAHWRLSIGDNGIGVPEELIGKPSDSMGMNLMKGLSDELGAEFKIAGDQGTQITVEFIYEPESEQ